MNHKLVQPRRNKSEVSGQDLTPLRFLAYLDKGSIYCYIMRQKQRGYGMMLQEVYRLLCYQHNHELDGIPQTQHVSTRPSGLVVVGRVWRAGYIR